MLEECNTRANLCDADLAEEFIAVISQLALPLPDGADAGNDALWPLMNTPIIIPNKELQKWNIHLRRSHSDYPPRLSSQNSQATINHPQNGQINPPHQRSEPQSPGHSGASHLRPYHSKGTRGQFDRAREIARGRSSRVPVES
jgi:hypothetical protein